ncbi:MAG: FHA domain-containing protein [Lachnospiraceae bacterium]|nr:FHA domain-containing protein [Lachnospiraceae bacterium]
MQIEYKKEWMDTYLCILPDNRMEESFEEKMIQYNPGGGRLEFSRQQKDGEDYFCYKVTGKKALNSIYAVLPIGEHQVRMILTQLFDTLEAGKEYLLSEEDYVLSPEYIFATFPQMSLEFCYIPGYGIPLKRQLEGLFEYLLNRVDYEDKQAVNLLYDCYMFCMREKGGLTEIKKLLKKNETEDVKTLPIVVPTAKSQVVYQEQEEHTVKKAATGSYVSWLAEKIFPWKKRESALVAESREEYVAEKATDCSDAFERTVLLTSVKQPEMPELICEQTGEVVPLSKFPFYIGSAREYADFVPAAEGVSRIHCCISKKENKYYLSDLNSTNGTHVNGNDVNPGKEVLLSENDKIRVCSQEFYIKFPCH